MNRNVPGSMCIRTGAWNVYVPTDTVTFTQGQDLLKVGIVQYREKIDVDRRRRIQSYVYLLTSRKFCPNCGTQMIITAADPNKEYIGIMALNVRAFQSVDYDKIKIRYADMKDEEPLYDVDAISNS